MSKISADAMERLRALVVNLQSHEYDGSDEFKNGVVAAYEEAAFCLTGILDDLAAEREQAVAVTDGLSAAILFHETYERLAPSFGYETRPDTKSFDPESKNGRLMIAVCEAVAPLLRAKNG